MRITIALVVYVSLTAVGVCLCSAETGETAGDWTTTHSAGLAAAQHHNYEEAIQFFKSSWPLSRTAMEKGISANDLGQSYRQLGRDKEAREWLEQACDFWRPEPAAAYYLAVAASALGDLYHNDGDYARAERFLREAIVTLDHGGQVHDPASADQIRNNLADLLREEGKNAEAQELFLKSLQNKAISSEQRVNALAGLADIDRYFHDWESSARRWNEVLAIAREQKDESTESVASLGLGSMWLSAGNPSRAEPLFHRAVWLAQNGSETAPGRLAAALSGLAGLYFYEEKLALAEDAWSKALKIQKSTLGDHHPQVAWLMEMLANVYSERGESVMARDYATRAVDVTVETFGEHTLPTAVALANRGTVEQRANQLDAAEKDYARAIGIAREHPGADPIEKTMIERYAGLLKAMHRNREAKEVGMLARSLR